MQKLETDANETSVSQIEVTPEMLKAGCDAVWTAIGTQLELLDYDAIAKIYRAMETARVCNQQRVAIHDSDARSYGKF